MAKGTYEEYNPKRRPYNPHDYNPHGPNLINIGDIESSGGGRTYSNSKPPSDPHGPTRKSTDPIPPDELVEEIKKVFPGTIETTDEY